MINMEDRQVSSNIISGFPESENPTNGTEKMYTFSVLFQ